MTGRWRRWRDYFLQSKEGGLIQFWKIRVLWKETKDGIFSVKSLYRALVSRNVVQFPNSIIWMPLCSY